MLRLKFAVTGINISDKPIEDYEYIEVALIADEVLAVSIRELTGEDLEDANSKLEAKQLNQGMEAAAKDWAAAFTSIFGR